MPSTFIATDAAGYEQMMGRWSRILAQHFLDYVGVLPNGRVLDLGCGTGSLTRAVLKRIGDNDSVMAIDIAEPYVAFAQSSITDPRAAFQVADVTSLDFAPSSFDAALSLLVLNFVPQYRAAAEEMLRVTRSGGTVAVATWNLSGGLVFMRMFWDTAAALDPAGAAGRSKAMAAPLTHEGELGTLFRELGAANVEEADLLIRMRFSSFEDYWRPYIAGQGTPGSYVVSLDEEKRERFRIALRDAYLAGRADGPRSFVGVATAIRARAP